MSEKKLEQIKFLLILRALIKRSLCTKNLKGIKTISYEDFTKMNR